MVVKPSISERTRSKKFSNLVNEKIKSPKKVGTTSAASISSAEGTKKKSRKTDESNIAVVPSSSAEPDTDDDVKFICEEKVEIDEESQKGKRNGKKNRATKKGVDKNKAIEIIEPEAKSEKKKKKKVNDVSRQKVEGKKEEKKKRKKVEEEDVVLLGEQDMIGAIKQRSEVNKEDKKSKGKEVEVKSPEKSKKGSALSKPPTEGKNDDKKKVVEGEKERTGKRRNECEKEDEKRKKKNKRQKTDVEEAKKQMHKTNTQRNEGAKKEKKQEDKKQKKKAAEVEGKKEDKKVKKRKSKEEKIEMQEENEKNNNVLYKFPMAQVSRIIKSEDLNIKIAQEAVFVINKAAEKFLELFCREAYARAFLDHKNHVAYNHLSSVVSKRRRFDFLSDFVPEKVKAEDALAEMSKAEAET